MRRSALASRLAFAAASVVVAAAPPVHAVGGRGGGPRGGGVGHVSGPMRSGTTVHGAYGGGVTHVQGPHGGGTVVHGPGVAGRPGAVGVGHVGPGGVAHVGVVRPGWTANRFELYQHRYVGYPGWRSYGLHYGLVAPLATFASLSFLSAGLLVGSYVEQEQTVYVYVVQEDGQDVEYRVAADGTVLSRRVVE